MRTVLTTLCFLTMSAVQAKAEVTVKEYKTRMASSDAFQVAAMKFYIRGLGEGLTWANTQARAMKTPLFCSPRKLALTLENYIDIIDRQIEKRSSEITQAELEGTFIGLMLTVGLEETFPCERN
jgi:hypothetical protein